jgi:hypothetical protein
MSLARPVLLAALLIVGAAPFGGGQALGAQTVTESEVLDLLDSLRRYQNLPQAAPFRRRLSRFPESVIPLLRRILADAYAPDAPGRRRANDLGQVARGELESLGGRLSRDDAGGGLLPAAARVAHRPVPRPGHCTVIDMGGEAYPVSGLSAVYWASGNWLGGVPSASRSALVFSTTTTEGRTTLRDVIRYDFSTTRTITHGWLQQADSVAAQHLWIIQLRDGREVTVSEWPARRLEERDRGGALLRTRDANVAVGFAASFPSLPEEEYLGLEEFRGWTVSRSGRAGRFSIPAREVVRIECR